MADAENASRQAILDKLAYIEETKNKIKSAIIDKGQTITDTTTFREYYDKIEAISRRWCRSI